MIAKGERINDRYEILSLLGEGGMANVYLADDTILNRKVAVKVLRGDLSSDEKFVRRFQREALSASSLSHPNIVEMYDVGEEGEQYYIVMEYVEGRTLKQLVKKRGTLTVSETIDVMLQLTSGLACAHDAYIIHRDIKPQNILVLENGLVKITDFGIAMAINNSQLTQTNSLLGSVHYLPPEQAGGKGSTMKSDIYSLGILMYEMLTGKIPFSGDNAVEIAMKHINSNIPSVRKQNNSIPQSIENIIMKATAKNPKNRYNDVKEMHADLETALNKERFNEAPYEYKFKEQEEDKPLKELPNQSPLAKKVDVDDDPSNQRKKLKILGFILGFLTLLAALIFVVIPMVTKVPEVKIPDVANMSLVDAESELKAAGLKLATETTKQTSDTVSKGKVIGTSPGAGKIVKKGKLVVIIISSGSKVITIEDYTGLNIETIREELETDYGLIIKTTEKEVSLSEAKENGIILSQTPKEGTKLSKGDKISFVITKVNDTIPDMVGGGWDLTMVQDFCDQNGLKLVTKEQESSTETEGLVISQSLKVGTKITSGQTLTVVIAVKKPEAVTEPTE